MAIAGDRIDKFTLVRQLGAGGMGSTWEAVRQVGQDFEQRVAIKLAEPDLLRTADGLGSFRREAALAASLRHPNIAAVLDVDEHAGYIVCELVDGADLRAVLRSTPGARLEPTVVVHLLAQIARGLSHAHRRILRGRPSPIIHRDMSPGNVVIDYDGNAKIVDFGIAKVLATGAEIAESVKGKLSYMAPEQAMGGRMDGRVDQYALGVIAYEALCGVRPNDRAHEGGTLACILEGKHVPLYERSAAIPQGLCRVVERMLALRPADRYESMEGVLDALADFTPRLTVHRSLVPLVMAAHQPHTILSENGRFVSRPVETPPPWAAESVRDASTTAPVGAVRGRACTPGSAGELAVTLGNTQPAVTDSAPPQLSAARAAPPPLPTVSTVSQASPRAAPTARPSERQTARAGRWPWKTKTLSALGVLVLALVSLVLGAALSPEAWGLRAALDLLGLGAEAGLSARAAAGPFVRPAPVSSRAAHVPPDPEASNVSGKDTETMFEALSVPPAGLAAPVVGSAGAAVARAPSAPNQPKPSVRPERVKRGESKPNAAREQKGLARVRVHAQPPALIWVDDTPTGEAAPELELNVAAGQHVIGVGDSHGQVERRSVELSADEFNVVSFEAPP